MMDPFTLAGAGALGISAWNSIFGPSQDELNEKNTAANQRLVEQRWAEMQRIFGRRLEFFREQMDIFNPQLAFAGTQGRLAAGVGARSAQANLRRQLGEGGGVFASALSAGAATGAADRQNTLRALATTEALRAADREVASRAGVLGSLPFAFLGPSTGGKSGQLASVFANLATGFGGLAEARKQPPAGGASPFGTSTFDPFPKMNLGWGTA